MKNSDDENDEHDKLINKHNKTKSNKKLKKGTRILYAFEKKKFGGVRMCQRCLRTKV